MNDIWGTWPNAAVAVLGDALKVGAGSLQAPADTTNGLEVEDNAPLFAQVVLDPENSSEEDLEWEATPPRKLPAATPTTAKKRQHRERQERSSA